MPKPYDERSKRGKIRFLARVARGALERYGMTEIRLKYLGGYRATNFRVFPERRSRRPEDPPSALLRIHHPESPSASHIRSEFQWLRGILADTDLAVPRPIRNLDGEDVTSVTAEGWDNGCLCSMTGWIKGRLRLFREGPGVKALFGVGKLMGALHLHGTDWVRPQGFERPCWDWEGILGASSPFFPDTGEGFLSEEERRLFETVSHRVREAMEDLGRGPEVFGLIHGDLIQINYLFHKGEVRAIDFGDCGFGHYLYDMGITLFALWAFDKDGAQRKTFVEGYREVRTFPKDLERLLPLFIAARGVAMARMIMGSGKEEDLAIIPTYIPRVIEWVRTWVK
ncbi:MAG: phosphotransferase enzyme family protein [Planctomycetota bacterium]|jgi:Ser/Thr protein kinase RdoA (MazF antagonist)